MMEYAGSGAIVMVCSDCNAHCKHCFINYTGGFNERDLGILCEKLVKRYKVILNGTELLLHPEFFDIMKMLNQDCILTNGIEVSRNPSVLKAIADAGIKYLGNSYHIGIHKDITDFPTHPISTNIRRALEYGIKTDIRVSITRNNLPMILEMCEVAQKLGADGIKFTNFMRIGRALNMSDENILHDADIEVFFKLLAEARSIYPKDQFLVRRCGSFGKCPGCDNFNCVAGKDLVVITPDLKVYPCFFLMRDDMQIGHVEDGKVMLTRVIDHDGSKCLARELNNFGYMSKTHAV